MKGEGVQDILGWIERKVGEGGWRGTEWRWGKEGCIGRGRRIGCVGCVGGGENMGVWEECGR